MTYDFSFPPAYSVHFFLEKPNGAVGHLLKSGVYYLASENCVFSHTASDLSNLTPEHYQSIWECVKPGDASIKTNILNGDPKRPKLDSRKSLNEKHFNKLKEALDALSGK